MGVDESWNVILEYLRRRSPAMLTQIRPPAIVADLRAAEEAVAAPLPGDLAYWWRLTDGTDRRLSLIPQGYVFSSVRESLSNRRTWLEVSAEPDHYAEDDRQTGLEAPAGTPQARAGCVAVVRTPSSPCRGSSTGRWPGGGVCCGPSACASSRCASERRRRSSRSRGLIGRILLLDRPADHAMGRIGSPSFPLPSSLRGMVT